MNTQIAYLILRVAVGVSMLGHGLVRLPKLQGFSAWMLKTFENSILPDILVLPFSYALPIVEFVLGILLVLGLFTRIASIVAAIIMILLIFGSTLIENWGALVPQFIHVAFFAYLIQHIDRNSFALDTKLRG
ncbi:DoxX family membrane protein [Maribacter polysiphoniae]|uniref:DoxX family membrane protein n=1 Tax=Maribacter polysiphoniae TaxID=429344 RepID=A0A316E3B6_9FLAO|nr:DoxX family membrane protein [Maribacter polysiphoniae]MBD1259001.1 DoxX family membrane protein [Maribacter polysiphoniae]PWK24555.1 thiosulfate dehydrogenase [quinone] large subunit [Maribacter polysiphoniae]